MSDGNITTLTKMVMRNQNETSGLRFELSNLRAEMNTRFSLIDEKIDKVLTILDGIAGRIEDDDIERAASTAQTNGTRRG